MTQREFIIITITTEVTTEITETTMGKVTTIMEYVSYDGKDRTMLNSEQMPKTFSPKILSPHVGTTN